MYHNQNVYLQNLEKYKNHLHQLNIANIMFEFLLFSIHNQVRTNFHYPKLISMKSKVIVQISTHIWKLVDLK